MTQSVSSNSITSLVSSKLTGALPAINGAALTGVSAGVFTSASDPTVTSNKTLGFLWANSVTGDLFNCTDATTNSNIWKNVGSGSGTIDANSPYTLGGTLHGYSAGGLVHRPTPVNVTSNVIDRFAFASSSNASDVGDLSKFRRFSGSTSSATHGYVMGGQQNNSGSENSTGYSTVSAVDKFQFAASANASVTTGNLSAARTSPGQGVIHTTTHGFCVGGYNGLNTIDKWQFSTDTVSNSSADLSTGTHNSATGCGTLYGYTFGGGTTGPVSNKIQKFSLSSHANATLLSSVHHRTTDGSNSWNAPTDTYIWGSGWVSPDGGDGKKISKFSLTSESDSVVIGDLLSHSGTPSGAIDYWVGQAVSSTTHGYRIFGGGGNFIPTGISRFSFSSEGTMTDVGDMTIDGGGGREDGSAMYT